MRNVRVSALAIACVLVGTLTEAALPGTGPQPDLEFLEFLGGWQTEDDKPLDPFSLDEMPIPDESTAERGDVEHRDQQSGESPEMHPLRQQPASTQDRDRTPEGTDKRHAR